MKKLTMLLYVMTCLFSGGSVFGMETVHHAEKGLRRYEQFFRLPQRLRAQLPWISAVFCEHHQAAWSGREVEREDAIALLLDMYKFAIILEGTKFATDLLTKDVVESQRASCVKLIYLDKVGSPYAALCWHRKKGLLADGEWIKFLDQLGSVAQLLSDAELRKQLMEQIALHRRLDVITLHVSFELPQNEAGASAPLPEAVSLEHEGEGAVQENDDPSAWARVCCFMCCLPCMLWYCRVSS